MNQENELEVDHEQLAGEAAEVPLPDSSAPGNGAAPAPVIGTIDQAPPDASWSELTPGLVVAIDFAVCPNWKLSEQEKTALDGALAAALDRLFPGGLGDERWAPYLRLLVVVVAIAGPRFDRERFRFKPLHEPKEKTPGEEGATPAPGANDSSFVVGAGS